MHCLSQLEEYATVLLLPVELPGIGAVGERTIQSESPLCVQASRPDSKSSNIVNMPLVFVDVAFIITSSSWTSSDILFWWVTNLI